MKLVWTRPATADRREIRTYIAQDNPVAALAIDELFTEKASRLVDQANIGRVSGTRELVAHKNYILIYDVVGNLVRVLRVLHAARQWPPERE